MAALLALVAALWLPFAAALQQLHRPWGHGEGVRHGHRPGRRAHASKHQKHLALPHAEDFGGAETDLPLAARDSEQVDILLCGEPKSGTTWLELIVYFAIKRLCVDSADPSGALSHHQDIDGSCAKDTPTLDMNESSVRVYRYTSMYHGAPTSFVASVGSKHSVPFARDTPPELVCTEGANRTTPPCGLDLNGTADRLLPALAACVDRCWARHEPVRRMRVLHVHRDPRDVAVSLCFWTHSDFSHSKHRVVDLQRCVMKRYASIALWVKFRELWFQRLEALRVARVYQVGYEDMLAHPEDAFGVITSALNMPATPAQLETLIDITAASSLAGDKAVDPHNGPSGSRKIRSAGKKTYRDYHFSPQLVKEMDRLYRELNFTASRAAGT